MGKSRFVWHDLMAADVEGAKRFYGELFGWRFDAGKSGGAYEHIWAGDRGIGGMVKIEAGQKIPPHWIGYVSVDDVKATVQAATRAGGHVVHEESLPEVGDWAVVIDPQGAVLAPFKSKRPLEPETNERPAPFTFCWDELLTSDPDAAVKFYGALFGWGAEHMEMGDFGRYTLLKRIGVKDEMGADKNAGGLMKMPPGVPRPHWLSYVAVPNADETVAKVKRLGGTVLSPPMDIPNVGRFATLMDTQHAAFAVLAPAS